ncbi:MAG: tetratricopeptide repeat protein [Candidatus Methylomirabilales bacterium]
MIAFALLFIANSVFAQSQAERVQLAEQYWADRASIAQVKKAADIFEKVLDEDPENYAAHWKLSQMYFWIGRHESSRGVKVDNLEKGIDLAEKAISLKPNEAGGHYWLGANSGALAEALAFWPWLLFRKVSLAGDFRREMQSVLRLDPAFDGGGAYRALGVYYLKKSSPDPQEAERFLEEAVESAPTVLCNHFYLAVAYAEQGKLDLARQKRTHVLATPVAADHVHADKQCKEEALAWRIDERPAK